MAFKPTNLPDQIARYLRNKIIRGELPPGKRIGEAELAQELGVSRGPIREAFLILEKKMLIELTPRRGVRVTEMSAAFIDCLYDVLTELYALLARKTAEMRTEEDLHALGEAMQKLEDFAAAGETTGYYEAVFEYSAVCRQIIRNPLLDRLLEDFEPSVRRTEFASFSQRLVELGRNVQILRDLTRYIQEGDGEAAAQTIRDYLVVEKKFAMELRMEVPDDQKGNTGNQE
ncbi:MAG: GntR family transcriptional regulator [bacterium]